MVEKINVAKLLRDCPQGMELDCVMYEDVYFDYVDKLNIIHCYIKNEGFRTSITFNQHGTPNGDIKSKCVIFPKGKTTWEGFKRSFKGGDIIYNRLQKRICIYQEHLKWKGVGTIAWCRYNEYHQSFELLEEVLVIDLKDYRLACETEKQKLFDAIKANGYKWNPVTKTLEPKFKNGDVVVSGAGNIALFSHTNSTDIVFYHCILKGFYTKDNLKIGIDCGIGDVENCRLASDEQKNAYSMH